MARGFARRLGATFAIIDKRRPSANVAEILNVVGEVDGRTCLIMDDMIDTGGTIVQAATALVERGARQVFVGATHALLSGPAVERLSAAPIAELVVTNTIPVPEEKHFDCLTILSGGPPGFRMPSTTSTRTHRSASSSSPPAGTIRPRS